MSSDTDELQIREEIDEYKNKNHIWCIFIIISCYLLLYSIVSEIFCGHSLSSYLAPKLPFLHNMRKLVDPDAILQVSEAVGLGSVPIACIYASWWRDELGLKYSALLRSIFDEYNTYVVIHFSAVLSCFWLSNIGALESALISLAIVLFGFPIQWNIFCCLILFPNNRRKIALYTWQEIFNSSNSSRPKKDIFQDICFFAAHCLETGRVYCNETIGLFSDVLLRFIKKDGSHRTSPQILYEVQVIWDHLLLQHTLAEQKVLVRQVFRSLSDKQCQDNSFALGIICTGYVLKMYSESSATNISCNIAPIDNLIQIANRITLLQRNIFGQDKNLVVHYLNTVILFLSSMYALDINYSDPQFEIPDDFTQMLNELKALKQDQYTSKNDRELLKLIKMFMFATYNDLQFEEAVEYTTQTRR